MTPDKVNSEGMWGGVGCLNECSEHGADWSWRPVVAERGAGQLATASI